MGGFASEPFEAPSFLPMRSISGMMRIVVYRRRWHGFSRFEAQGIEQYGDDCELTPICAGWVRSRLEHKRETFVKRGFSRRWIRDCARGMAR